jgi:hypothetical protein
MAAQHGGQLPAVILIEVLPSTISGMMPDRMTAHLLPYLDFPDMLSLATCAWPGCSRSTTLLKQAIP